MLLTEYEGKCVLREKVIALARRLNQAEIARELNVGDNREDSGEPPWIMT
jgi:hypothetical protein